MNRKKLLILYLFLDYISASASWAIFYTYRKTQVEPLVFGYDVPMDLGYQFFLGVTVIPVFWLMLYYLSGSYEDVLRKSRLLEMGQTMIIVLTGVTIIFFVLILDDVIVSYKDYYSSFFILAGIQFTLTYIPRLTLTTYVTIKVRERKIAFNTLMIGSNDRAVEIYQEIEEKNNAAGSRIVGFVNGNARGEYQLSGLTRHLGSVDNIKEVVAEHNIEEIIIALDTSENEAISKIINNMGGTNVVIKAIPDLNDIVSGKVRVKTIFGTPLIEITHALMPVWQANLKRMLDILLSILALVVMSPVILMCIIGVKVSSRGPVLLRQQRIGRYGKPFTLYKFRSMYNDAEKNGPELSRKNDSRLTPFGRFMRQRKLDEIPNFINVLKGEMSLVGPRPEREYYVDKIVRQAPHYVHLHKVKPGITSWGQVKYGYAVNVNEMVMRLKYDLLYIENMSLLVDFQIMISTLLAIFRKENI